MRAFFLVFTFLFAVSFLEDCCHFEVEGLSDGVSVVAQAHDCSEAVPHGQTTHCHCSPTYQKIFSNCKVVIAPASQIVLPPNFFLEDRLVSTFEPQIFHPPALIFSLA